MNCLRSYKTTQTDVISDLTSVKSLVDSSAENAFTDHVELVKGAMVRLNDNARNFFTDRKG